jgi:hypothetical protein
MRISRVMAAAAFVALSSSATARAGNLIVNSDFPADVTTAWTSLGTGGTVAWDNVNGSPLAGSAHFVAANAGAAVARSLTQCVAIAAPNNFDYIVRTVINSSSGTAVSLARVRFFGGASCTGIFLGASDANTLSPVGGGWIERSLVNTPLPPAPPTVSALVELTAISGSSVNDHMDINFDDVRFGIAGTVAVELQSFTAE